MTTPDEVANWMAEKLKKDKYLYHETVVYQIRSAFGSEFVYINENGNLAIDRRVLLAFRKLTADDVVWERGERMWRRREKHDPSHSRQVD